MLSRIVQLSSLGGSYRHARVHDGALVSGVHRRRRLTGHLLCPLLLQPHGFEGLLTVDEHANVADLAVD
jgi:hypothetical protein